MATIIIFIQKIAQTADFNWFIWQIKLFYTTRTQPQYSSCDAESWTLNCMQNWLTSSLSRDLGSKKTKISPIPDTFPDQFGLCVKPKHFLSTFLRMLTFSRLCNPFSSLLFCLQQLLYSRSLSGHVWCKSVTICTVPVRFKKVCRGVYVPGCRV